MSKYAAVFNKTQNKVVIQDPNADIPSGYISIGQFDHDDSADGLGPEVNHVLYQHVRDLLYFQKEYNMQIISITTQAGIPVTGVSLAPASLMVTVGGTGQLVPTLAPSNASDTKVTYESSNPATATVDEKGVVTGVAVGTVTMTVTTDSGGFTAKSTVQVYVKVTGVSATPTQISVAVGSTEKITATIAPANATDKNVSWNTSDSTIATVGSDGTVTGVAAGAATITATTEDGNFQANVPVTVTAAS